MIEKKVKGIRSFFVFGGALAILLAIVNFHTAVRAENEEVIDRVVAIVNNEIITLADLNVAAEPFVQKIKASGYSLDRERKVLFEVRERLLKRLVEEELIKQEAKKNNITVSEKQIDQTIERLKETRYFTDEDIRKMLKDQGLTMETYRNTLKGQISRKMLLDREIGAKVVVVVKEIREYFDSHEEFHRGFLKYYLINIMCKISPDSPKPQKDQALSTMEEIRSKLNNGGSYKNVLSEYADSMPSISGSDLGWFEFEDLSDQLKDGLKGVKSGKCSRVQETLNGYQAVFVQEVRESSGRSFEEAKPEIEELIFNKKVEKKYKEWIEGLRKRSHIKINI